MEKIKRKDRKGATSVTSLIITLLVFGMIITGFALFLTDMSQLYGISPDTNFSSTLSHTAKIQNISRNMAGQASSGNTTSVEPTEVSSADVGYRVILGFISAFKLAWNLPGILYAMIIDISAMLGIPSWAIITLISIAGIFVLGVIYYTITGKEG